MSDEDMSDEDANFPHNTNSQEDLKERIAELEHRLQNALTSIDSYQNERFELVETI